eukprot:SAG11_NODE_10883_length_799_cov_1.320000_1_plen_170_part_00
MINTACEKVCTHSGGKEVSASWLEELRCDEPVLIKGSFQGQQLILDDIVLRSLFLVRKADAKVFVLLHSPDCDFDWHDISIGELIEGCNISYHHVLDEACRCVALLTTVSGRNVADVDGGRACTNVAIQVQLQPDILGGTWGGGEISSVASIADLLTITEMQSTAHRWQ